MGTEVSVISNGNKIIEVSEKTDFRVEKTDSGVVAVRTKSPKYREKIAKVWYNVGKDIEVATIENLGETININGTIITKEQRLKAILQNPPGPTLQIGELFISFKCIKKVEFMWRNISASDVI